MKRLLIDTNIILDLLAKRKDYYQESKRIFALSDNNKIELVISTLSIANAHYILSEILKTKRAKEILGKFKVLVISASLSDKIIELALNDSKFKDFEDGIQYYTALENKCDFIITRNIRDFKYSTIPVMRPKEYLSIRQADK